MVKQGYKQTDIGVIPEDWKLMPSGEFIEVLTDFTANGSFASLAENVTYLDYPDYARLVRLTDIRTNFKNQGIYVSKDSYEFLAKSSLFGGELLLANVGAYAGYSFLFQKSFQEYATLGPNMFLVKANKNILREEYLPLVFGYGTVFKQLIEAAASSAQPKINKDNVRKSVAIIPPLNEQKRIAEALSDVDSMISALEKLVTKKKAVKQGAMQELLTGKKRVPGFSGEWYETTVGEHCCVFDGTHQTPKYTITGIPFYSVENITASDFVNTKFITAEEHEQLSSKCKIEKGDILMTRIGSIGDCKYIDWDVNASFYVSLALIKCKETINAQFLSFYSTSSYFKKEIEIRSLLTAIPQKINLGPISEIKLNIPSDIKEQEAIASVLSDMDNEIEVLEQKLAKNRLLKQGMMQQLLTGKIRLV